ncbi:MAG: hypothetical protein AMXMBFR58_32460 [Phycisphaerae bacterium]
MRRSTFGVVDWFQRSMIGTYISKCGLANVHMTRPLVGREGHSATANELATASSSTIQALMGRSDSGVHRDPACVDGDEDMIPT